MKELIKNITEKFGVSGYETSVANFIEEQIKPYADNVYRDVLGNLIAVKGSGEKKIMIAGHMDQIGFIITHIDDNGFVMVHNVGGIRADWCLFHKVIFQNGTIGIVAPSGMFKPNKDDVTVDKLNIDIGAKNKAEAEKMVSIGDVAVFKSEMSESNGLISTMAMDDRCGCAIMIETLKRMQDTPHSVYFVFTVQEEVGLRGAVTSAYTIEPDMGIALDVTATGDTPDSMKMPMAIGKGPAIKIKDNSLMVHPKVKKLMIDRAVEAKIPYQLEILPFGGTDAGAIHLTKGGVPSGTISIPCRYVHSPNETVSLDDLENCVKLLKEIVTKEIDFI